MDKRRKQKHSNWNNQKNNAQKNVSQQINNQQTQNLNQNNDSKRKSFQFNQSAYENEDTKKEKQKAILEIKSREVICAKCGQQITDISSALSDKKSGNPIHFECAIKEVESTEKVGENEKIAYIGQGRFGVLYYENPRDQRKFTIKKIIEWEDREKKSEWRDELSGLYSQID